MDKIYLSPPGYVFDETDMEMTGKFTDHYRQMGKLLKRRIVNPYDIHEFNEDGKNLFEERRKDLFIKLQSYYSN